MNVYKKGVIENLPNTDEQLKSWRRKSQEDLDEIWRNERGLKWKFHYL